ncbi:TonB family protein [Mesorhizobium sp. ESP6-5]|uniref:energy transducer TonB n=1 Tax=Mesorhizobium sp. ESP6-5 TaxID=2876623 RepID=UPI002962297D|nr:TonB family protein [Mesorhizobium sp. ESP6-5]
MAGPLAGFDCLPVEAADLDLTSLRVSLQFRARDMQEINPLPDAGSELAIAPAERLAQARPQASNGKWQAAIAISCLLHAGVAAAFLISSAGKFDSREAEQSEGGDHKGDKVAGSALDKDPAAMNVTLVPPPPTAKPHPAKAARPAPTAPSQPAQEPVTHTPEPARDAAKQASEPSAEPVKQPVATPDILVAATPRPDDQSVAARTETPAQPNAQAETTEIPVTVPDQPPIPVARPTGAAAPATAGAANERSGTADGQDRLAEAASKGKRQKDPGSTAEDSYRGNVFRKLGSVNRTLPPSLQLAARNNAVVAFAIGRKGDIDQLRILESSGSPTFDEAALGIVRKAAPFPPIPSQASNPSLEFEVGIGPF